MSIADAATIVAIATAPGQAGVGILRLSGPGALAIGEAIAGPGLRPRHAHHRRFRDAGGDTLDDGLVLYFPGPRSYTGEDVLELQGHGSPVLLQALQRRCLELGARLARPGEFTERAFLNDRLDLAQAEAVADLIAAGSERAARAARRSLDGLFSRRVEELTEKLIAVRVYIEAALDFPDEEIDFLAAPELARRLDEAADALHRLRFEAEQGRRLRDGLHVVIVGAPNAGKSSLLNALVGEDRAIVTDVAGTTRDLLREDIALGGVSLTLVDTAGLRDAPDPVEAEGIRRARKELQQADLVLAVVDDRQEGSADLLEAALADAPRVLWLHSKCDLPAGMEGRPAGDGEHLWLSARTGEGMDALRARLHGIAGAEADLPGSFSARERHLDALGRAASLFDLARRELRAGHGELSAEQLRRCQAVLGEITGVFDADALLGRIFSSFCIGK